MRFWKTMGLAALAGLAITSAPAYAIPSTLSLQGYLTNAAGNAQDGTYTLTVTLWSAETGGTQLFTQTLAGVQVRGGLFDLVIGADTAISSDVFRNNNAVWMQVELDAGPGVSANEAPLPRQPLTSSPFAFASHFATSATSATTANTATTANGLVCTNCVAITELEFDPATQAELEAAVANVVTTSALTNTLQNYATTSSLSAYATTASLSAYATTASLSAYVTSAGLATTLNGYVSSGALTTALGNYVSNTALTTQLNQYVKTTDLTTTLAGYAKLADIPTSIEGLGGGAIEGDVAVSGDLNAAAVLQNGNAVCDTSGNCGPTLGSIQNCTNGQVVTYDNGSWKCANAGGGGANPPVCTGAWRSLQYDDTNGWRCIDLRASGLSGGKANAYEVVDAWGAAWDGVERGARAWQAAQDQCVALGGRLPTVTELWRNNAGSGTGNLGNSSNSNELWTIILNSSANRMTVRVSDGGINGRGPTSSYPFRCIWPDRISNAFDGDYCYGPAGSECAPARRWYNIDKYDRPALDLVAATNECNFYNASIPNVEDWTEIIHSGVLPATYVGLSGSDIMYYSGAPYVLHSMVRWDTPRAKNWAFDSNAGPNNNSNWLGNWNWPTSVTQFRCMGKRAFAEGVNPESPECSGAGCFSITPSVSQAPDKIGRRSPIWADGANRTAASRDSAAAQCAALGGTLPTVSEFMELVHAGLPFTTAEMQQWLWTANPAYHGNYQNFLARRYSGWADRRMWYQHHDASITWDPGNANYNFRCVWHQTQREAPFTCANKQDINYDGTNYSCTNRVLPTDNGNANGGPFTDSWGNVWDSTERGANSQSGAQTVCQAIGGRLPTATEIWRIRGGGPNPGPNATGNYLWTRIPSYRVDYNVTNRVSDGATSDHCTTNCTTQYRCIWPVSAGTVFSNGSCNGPTAGTQEPCFRTGRYIADKFDRARLFPSSAAEECRLAGGWLTGLRSFEEILHGGAPNGDNNTWTWIMEPLYYYQSSQPFTMALAKWSGIGTAGWAWNNQVQGTATLAGAGGAYAFRCAWSDWLR